MKTLKKPFWNVAFFVLGGLIAWTVIAGRYDWWLAAAVPFSVYSWWQSEREPQ